MFTPAEAETILRELWTDAEEVGGFCSPFHRGQIQQSLVDSYGEEVLVGWTLIGETSWMDYEEGRSYYLFVKDSDQTLWWLASGNSVYGDDYGTDFSEIDPTTIEAWLEAVRGDIEFNNNSGVSY